MRFLIALIALTTSSLTCAQELKPGKWELLIKSEMTGIPVPPQSRTITYCVDDKNKNQPFIGNDTCRFGDKAVQGNKVSWKMTCEGDPKMLGDITLVIDGEKYSGTSDITMTISGAPNMSMKGTYTGRFLGPC